ncbi:MAG: ribonuclease III [Ignavibacteria bacterium]|jgi:ribonuclease-3|nr:ribonuclease III [Ignavibacteria bacterium]
MFELLKKNLRKFLPFSNESVSDLDSNYNSIFKIDFDSLQKVIHYKIIDRRYFITALTHRSFLKIKSNPMKIGIISNERLEFLGDAVLDLVVAEYLYKNFPLNEEGDLTKFRSILVNKRFLAERAKNINLGDFILASFTAKKSIEEGYDTILSDAYESLIGAIFMDSGYDSAKEFLNEEIFKKLDVKWLNQFDENHKSKFLEYVQAQTDFIPEYSIIKQEGPEHNKLFTVEVFVNKRSLGIGKGKSKKQAEQEAAKSALKHLDVLEKMGLTKNKLVI